MNPTQQLNHFEKTVDKMRRTLLSKGDDYAGKSDSTDRLSNFKQAGAVTSQSPVKVALTLMAIKISRLTALLDSGSTPNNESVTDTSLDLCCYAVLTDALLTEIKEGSNNG